MSIECLPELGKKPISLTVRLPAIKGITEENLGAGIREMYRKGLFTDVALFCAEKSFLAHRVVLASQSEVFRAALGKTATASSPSGKEEFRLAEIANPEAVKFMLDHMYQMDLEEWQDYNPRTQEINKDVLRLAENFRLTTLRERATHWLAKDLTTGNVVERLKICDDFALTTLREKILEQLTYNKKALSEVASSPQIMSYPKLMQSMLQLAAAAPEDTKPSSNPQPKKKGRKA
uniref:BTB domain-containing protein n=1 Tax=Zooxanthella nutricula TaxID=1333877 RepID=A0A7S2HKK5_9DINO